MSLCGGLGGAKSPSEEDFLHHIVKYEEFVNDPMMVENPNLVVRIDGKLYNWRTACPIVMSTVIFQKPLPQVNNIFNLTLNNYINIIIHKEAMEWCKA